MELEVLGKKELVNVPDDVYAAEVCNIREAEYEYGKVLIIAFKIIGGLYSGKEVNGLCKAIITPRSKLYEWATALGVGLKEGSKVDTNALLGKRAKIVTKTRSLNQPVGDLTTKVSNVDRVLPA